MMTTSSTDTFEYQLHVKQMELNSLLEVTQAINNNLPEEALFKIYHFILRANLRIQKLLLCICQETWEKKAVFGTQTSFDNVNEHLCALEWKEVTCLADENVPAVFQEFDILIPVFHHDAVLAYVFLSQASQEPALRADTNFIQTLTSLIVVAIENKKLAAKQWEQEALSRELQTAKRVQNRLFPKQLPQTPSLTVQADYLPHQTVSGDYYDYIALPDDKHLICIADVSGKGIPAALLMSSFQASLRILARQTTDLPRIVAELNHALYQILAGERFVTGFFALWDRPARRLTYLNAGHHPPLLAHAGHTRWLQTGTTVIGIFDVLPFINCETIENLENFLLFCFTDGVVEARNEAEEEFGVHRIQTLVADVADDAAALHRHLLQALDDFKGQTPFTDDVTMLTLKATC